MDKKILLVYYSRTWRTSKVAEYIKQLTNCDIEEIIDKKKRTWILWYIWAGRDAALKKITQIQQTKFKTWDYDILIIGTPVRDFAVSPAIRSYIQENKGNLPPKIIFYCTTWNSWERETFQEMIYLCSKKPIWTIYFKTQEILKNKFQEKLKNFLEKII
jgi:flavodoxin